MITFKYLVTSALPYASGPPHIGNLIGSVLPADVYQRFLKIDGEECRYVCGTDEHGTPITTKAVQENRSPQELVDENYREMKGIFEEFNIDFDVFSRTTKEVHKEKTKEIYQDLKENGYIYKEDVEILYCTKCKRSLPDRFVKGECPECGAEEVKGDQCDECGALFDTPTELIDYHCAVCGSKPEKRQSEHVFFKLSKLQDYVESLLKEKENEWSKTAVKLTENLLKEGLRDKDISRNMEWGIDIPDHPGQVFYVWIEAPIGYLSFSKEINIDNWWTDEETKLVQFLAKDNVPFHTTYFPATLKATGKNYIKPEIVAASQYLNYEGGQFSKSRGRGFSTKEALEMYPSDYWRYTLIKMYPKNRDRDFSWKEFQKIVNGDLNDTIGNFIHRTLTFTKNFFNSKVPQPSLTEKDEEILKEVNKTMDKTRELVHEVELNEALEEVTKLARKGNRYISEEEPWKNESRRKEVIYVSLQITKALSILLDPFIPETSSKIKKVLGISANKVSEAVTRIEPGKEINEFSPLFKKITDEEVKKYREKYRGKEKGGEEMSKVSFNDFKKLDIRTGQVKEVEEIEGSDNLYKVKVDIGKEVRNCVAGLKNYYSAEELKGKKAAVVVNLEPAEIMGVKSEAMFLAAVKGDEVSLLTPDKDIEIGSKVE